MRLLVIPDTGHHVGRAGELPRDPQVGPRQVLRGLRRRQHHQQLEVRCQNTQTRPH